VISPRTGAGRRAADPLCSIEEGPIRRDHSRAFPPRWAPPAPPASRVREF